MSEMGGVLASIGIVSIGLVFCCLILSMAFASLIMSSMAAQQAEQEGAVWLASNEPRSPQDQAYSQFLDENSQVPYSAFGAGGGDGWLQEEVA